jgi:small subunit ribosomal protein S4e
MMVMMQKHVLVDGKVRTDVNFPAGFMDVISLPAVQKLYRLLYDIRGRFRLVQLDNKEAGFKLCRVKAVSQGSKAYMGHNPYVKGQAKSIPYIVTHDGRTIRYPDPLIKVNDTVKVDIATGKIVGFLKFEVGQLAMVTGGNNVGQVGHVVNRERHLGSFDIVHIRDRQGNTFATRLGNVFIIGDAKESWVKIPHLPRSSPSQKVAAAAAQAPKSAPKQEKKAEKPKQEKKVEKPKQEKVEKSNQEKKAAPKKEKKDAPKKN